ncbi:MAG: substrate-binding domain-containing protein [Candidatus Promineifilaceae bacterium]|nr:substrate-binding domain-containing protein [Candidatus Promineifilaceae bacterium]
MSSAPSLASARLLALLWLLAFALVSAGCAEDAPPPRTLEAPPPPVTLDIGLSSSAGSFATLVAAPYAEETERAVLNFVTGNSAVLLDELAAGQFDAVLTQHVPAESELWFNPVALDALAIVVHPDNPLRRVSRSQLQAIYSGQIDEWAAVGSAGGAIVPVGREQGSAARATFEARIMGERRTTINSLIATGNQALLQAVAADPQAIGYTMLGALDSERDVTAVAVEGTVPSPQSTESQEYLLSAPLYFVTREEPSGPQATGAELRAFLAWLQSPAGQEILSEKYGGVR